MSGQSAGSHTSPMKHKGLKVLIVVLAVILAVIVLLDVSLYFGLGLFGLEPQVTTSSKAAEKAAEAAVDGVTVKSSVEQYTWGELSDIAGAMSEAGSKARALDIAEEYNLCASDGTLDGTQTKSIVLSDGTQTSAVIVGLYHDDRSDGTGKAGITFMFQSGVSSSAMNAAGSSTGGWQSSDIRGWLSSTLLTELPTDLAAALVPVDKFTNNVGNTKDTASVTTTSDTLWLFSVAELCGGYSTADIMSLDSQGYDYVADIIPTEGYEYELFADQGVYEGVGVANTILQMTYVGSSTDKFTQGSACAWWERTCNPGFDNLFLYVDAGGNPVNNDVASASYAVVPGFCL